MIDTKIAQLRALTDSFLFIDFYSHTNCEMYKINNQFTNYSKDTLVLCSVEEGIEKALDLAIEQITIQKDKFYGK